MKNQYSAIRLIIAMGLILALGGCANWTSIHRVDELKGENPKVILTDAKHWPIFVSGKREGNLRRFCSGVSPDALSALAISLGLQASVAKITDPVSKDVSAKLSSALSESATTIERTQTVNVLRELMFRTCERFMSGAIGQSEFIVQAARDQRAIIAILAIEQLTGISKAQSTAIANVVSSSSSGVSNESVLALQKAREKLESKNKVASDKKNEAQAVEPKDIACDALDGKKDAHKKKKVLCDSAAVLAAQAKDEKAHYESLKENIEKVGEVSADASGSITSAELKNTAISSETVASAIVEIVKEVGNFDEIEMTCVVLLRLLTDTNTDTSFPDQKKGLKETCFELVKTRVNQKTSEARLAQLEAKEKAELIKVRLGQLEAEFNKRARVIWGFVAPNGKYNSTLFSSLLTESGTNISSFDRHRIDSARSFGEFSLALGKLDQSDVERLYNAAK